MSRYSKIYRKMWGDARFRELTQPPPNGQSLWIRLLSGPELSAVPGLISIGEAGFAERLHWPLKGFREAFAEAFAKGMVEADWEAQLIWVPNAIRYNEPQSPNVVASWHHSWDELPECELKLKAYHGLLAFLEGFGEAFAEAFRKACRKPSPNHKQEQDQDQELEHCVLTHAADDDSSITGIRVTRPANSNRGTRITDDWLPTQTESDHSWHQEARRKNFAPEHVSDIIGAFRAYYTVGRGAKTKHIDWDMAWRNWLRKEPEYRVAGTRYQKRGDGVHQQPAAAGQEGWAPRGLVGAK